MTCGRDGRILAATEWKTNAELIAAMHELGYLRDTDVIYDPTYGKGNWWKIWTPPNLYISTLEDDGVDFQHTPYDDEWCDAIAFDPPYVCVGGRTTSGIPAMHEAYGLIDAPRTPAELQELINDGLTDCYRQVRPSLRCSMSERGSNGIVVVKCQDYVSSGKLWIGTHYTLTHALSLGFECWDRLEHVAGVRPQPANRTRADGRPVVQQHARRNVSTLLVLRKHK